MKAMLGALVVLALAVLPEGASPAADRAPASASGEAPATASSAQPAADGGASRDKDSAATPDQLLSADGPPPGTCPVTEEIVAAYCAEHPDDSGCRAYRDD